MPSLSYKDRFCEYVKAYSKTQTIRAFRRYIFRPGQVLSHFWGLRTKYVTRLIPNTICTEVFTIYILKDGRVYLGNLVTSVEARRNLKLLEKKKTLPLIDLLTDEQKDLLAYNDGFRPNSLQDSRINKKGCFNEMITWWKGTHSLPFTGQLIKWEKPD